MGWGLRRCNCDANFQLILPGHLTERRVRYRKMWPTTFSCIFGANRFNAEVGFPPSSFQPLLPVQDASDSILVYNDFPFGDEIFPQSIH